MSARMLPVRGAGGITIHVPFNQLILRTPQPFKYGDCVGQIVWVHKPSAIAERYLLVRLAPKDGCEAEFTIFGPEIVVDIITDADATQLLTLSPTSSGAESDLKSIIDEDFIRLRDYVWKTRYELQECPYHAIDFMRRQAERGEREVLSSQEFFRRKREDPASLVCLATPSPILLPTNLPTTDTPFTEFFPKAYHLAEHWEEIISEVTHRLRLWRFEAQPSLSASWLWVWYRQVFLVRVMITSYEDLYLYARMASHYTSHFSDAITGNWLGVRPRLQALTLLLDRYSATAEWAAREVEPAQQSAHLASLQARVDALRQLGQVEPLWTKNGLSSAETHWVWREVRADSALNKEHRDKALFEFQRDIMHQCWRSLLKLGPNDHPVHPSETELRSQGLVPILHELLRWLKPRTAQGEQSRQGVDKNNAVRKDDLKITQRWGTSLVSHSVCLSTFPNHENRLVRQSIRGKSTTLEMATTDEIDPLEPVRNADASCQRRVEQIADAKGQGVKVGDEVVYFDTSEQMAFKLLLLMLNVPVDGSLPTEVAAEQLGSRTGNHDRWAQGLASKINRRIPSLRLGRQIAASVTTHELTWEQLST